jgi:hypothetical protein
VGADQIAASARANGRTIKERETKLHNVDDDDDDDNDDLSIIECLAFVENALLYWLFNVCLSSVPPLPNPLDEVSTHDF